MKETLTCIIIILSSYNLNASAGQTMPLCHNKPLPVALIELGKALNLPMFTNWQEAKQAFSFFGRNDTIERWELTPVKASFEKKSKIIHQLKQLGFITQINPSLSHYDYALVLGGTVPSMLSRLSFLIKQWQQGIRFNQIVFLTGERPLSDQADKFQTNIKQWSQKADVITWTQKNLPQDETEASKILYHLANLPAELQKIPVTYISTPRSWNPATNTWFRANTKMTIDTWLSHNKPIPGKVLAVSSQPSASYQHQMLNQTLPTTFFVETIAPDCSDTIPLAVQLDAVWLWLKNQ